MADWQLPLYNQEISMVGAVTNCTTIELISATTDHTKGAWQELVSSSDLDVTSFFIFGSYVTYYGRYLLDIGIGASGSEEVIVPNLKITNGAYYENKYYAEIPISIASGTRISARLQCDNGTAKLRCGVVLTGNQVVTGHSLTDYGINTSTSDGVTVDPGTTINTKGSWVEISSSIDTNARGIFIAVGVDALSVSDLNFALDIGIGASGSEQVIIPDIPLGVNSDRILVSPEITPVYWIPISEGMRISVRASASGNTSRLLNVSIYCVN